MARRLHVEPSALEEFRASVYYVEDHEPGLGDALTADVEALTEALCERPESFAIIRRSRGYEARAAISRRFRFRVVFVMRPRSIWVVSIARQSRRPFYWLSRLENEPPP